MSGPVLAVVLAHHEALLLVQGGLVAATSGAGAVVFARWRRLRRLLVGSPIESRTPSNREPR